MRRCFYKLELDQPLNAEAARLHAAEPDLFAVRVQESIRLTDIELHAGDAPSVIKCAFP